METKTLSQSRSLLRILVLGCLATIVYGCASQSEAGQRKKKMTQAPTHTVSTSKGKEVATLAGGCFWCTEAIFTQLKGVDKVESGYSGGKVPNPTYEQVCGGDTGYAEAIHITFDPKILAFHDLLEVFLTTHDPTTLNRQGADSGTQYRSAIFYHSAAQKETAQKVIKEIGAKHIWKDPIVTEIAALKNFYAAEDYHQNFFNLNFNRNGYCSVVIAPKLRKLIKEGKIREN